MFWSKFDLYLLATLGFSFYVPFTLYGPVYFFYLRNVVNEKNITIKDLVHFLPFLFVMVFFGRFYFLSTEKKIELITTMQIQGFIYIGPYLQTIVCILLLAYALFSYNTYVKRYKKDPDLMLWLKSLSTVFTIFTLAFVVYYILVYTSLLKIEHDYLLTYIMVGCIGVAAYFSFMQPEVFNGKPIVNIIPFMQNIKYEKTGLSPNFSKELKEKLEQIMALKRPYLNQDLRLNHIAELLDISRNSASQIINEHFDQSFFDFINMYRVSEAERLLENKNNQLSITDIAIACGFNNRVSFYKAFKKRVGITPTEYRNQKLAS